MDTKEKKTGASSESAAKQDLCIGYGEMGAPPAGYGIHKNCLAWIKKKYGGKTLIVNTDDSSFIASEIIKVTNQYGLFQLVDGRKVACVLPFIHNVRVATNDECEPGFLDALMNSGKTYAWKDWRKPKK